MGDDDPDSERSIVDSFEQVDVTVHKDCILLLCNDDDCGFEFELTAPKCDSKRFFV